MNPAAQAVSLPEPARSVPIQADCDVMVCGGGPAGVAAALAAARAGARVILIEAQGCLGGVWTAGCLSWIIDHENKGGLMAELLVELTRRGARATRPDGRLSSAYDVEAMKALLEELCASAGVRVRLHTRVVATRVEGRRLTHVFTESKSGREAWSARLFVDASGDGDLAARAGCGFDLGSPADGSTQPMTLMMLVAGIRAEEVRPFIGGEGAAWGVPHRALLEAIRAGGHEASYSYPVLFRLRDDLFAIMANHQYGASAIDADAVTRATLAARAELHRVVAALRANGGPWASLHLVATGAHIGVREGRRIHGRYLLTGADLARGARFPDAVCRATFCVDIHSTNPAKDKGLHDGGIKTLPYDIPLRSLIARDVDGLLLAGRCISGDFFAHGSYRVTGNAVAMGEAAGRVAAECAVSGRLPQDTLPPELRGE